MSYTYIYVNGFINLLRLLYTTSFLSFLYVYIALIFTGHYYIWHTCSSLLPFSASIEANTSRSSHALYHLLYMTCSISHALYHMLYMTCSISHALYHMLYITCSISHALYHMLYIWAFSCSNEENQLFKTEEQRKRKQRLQSQGQIANVMTQAILCKNANIVCITIPIEAQVVLCSDNHYHTHTHI